MPRDEEFVGAMHRRVRLASTVGWPHPDGGALGCRLPLERADAQGDPRQDHPSVAAGARTLVGGMSAFCPFSDVELDRVADLISL